MVLSFGGHESDLDYLLVSNLLTRKIRAAWEHKTNEFRSHGKAEPRQLIIVVEEAHKLLNREMAAQTTFATIAREQNLGGTTNGFRNAQHSERRRAGKRLTIS